MVDLGISRTQDIQNPLPVNTPAAHLQAASQERAARAPAAKPVREAPAEPRPAGAAPADLDKEVNRLNALLGSNTRIRFVINRSTKDVYVEVVDKDSNEVLKTVPPKELDEVAQKLSGGGILVDNRF
jgi:uncharacterized FlaG/YvyC family protein